MRSGFFLNEQRQTRGGVTREEVMNVTLQMQIKEVRFQYN